MSLIKKFFKAIFGSKPEKQIIKKQKFETVQNLTDLSTKTPSLEKHEKIGKYFSEIKNKFNFIKRTRRKKREKIENEVFNLEFYTNDTDLVRAHLISEGKITYCTAIMVYGIDRLGAIIYQLKKRGMEIKSIKNKELWGSLDYTTYILKNNPYENN
jgi:hypothetical protein